MTPKIFLYFINWNDSFYLPFIQKHYGQFCEKITMYDNYSSDHSFKIAKELGFEIRLFGKPGSLDDGEYLRIKNQCWKESRDVADYVIVADADEFVYHPHITAHLTRCLEKKISILKTSGYDMFDKELPVNNILEIKSGLKSKKYSKNLIFSPKLVDEINFNIGSHRIYPKGQIKKGGKVYVLHYRNIGGAERLISRHKLYQERISKFNLDNNYGREYLLDEEQKYSFFLKGLKKSSKLKLLKHEPACCNY